MYDRPVPHSATRYTASAGPAPLTDEELAAITARTTTATPGPWIVDRRDDDHLVDLTGIATAQATGTGDGPLDTDHVRSNNSTHPHHPICVRRPHGQLDEQCRVRRRRPQRPPRMLTENGRRRVLTTAPDQPSTPHRAMRSPRPQPLDTDRSPAATAIRTLLIRIKSEIEDEDSGWNGGDIVDLLTGWFSQLSFTIDEPSETSSADG